MKWVGLVLLAFSLTAWDRHCIHKAKTGIEVGPPPIGYTPPPIGVACGPIYMPGSHPAVLPYTLPNPYGTFERARQAQPSVGPRPS